MQARPNPLLTWRWCLPVAAFYLIGLCWLSLGLRHNLGFPLDDSWIHQEIARNLIQRHTLGFTPGVTTSGSSSTLWTLILALNYVLLPTYSPVLFALTLNSLLLVLSGVLLWRMAVRDGLPLLESLAFAFLPALCGNYVWLAFIGMEQVFFVTLSLVSIQIWFRSPDQEEHDSGWRSSLVAGIALGELGITRPEGLALCVLLFALYRSCGRTLADVLRAAAVAALFLTPSFVINLRTSGSLLPLTLRGRRFLYFGSDHLHIGRSTVRSLVLSTYQKVVQHNFLNTKQSWAMAFVALALYGGFVLLRRFPNRTSLLVLWALLDYASYSVTLPTSGHGGRYQPFVPMLFPALTAIALLDLIALVCRLLKPRRGIQRPAQIFALLAMAALTGATLPRWSRGLHDAVYDIDNCHVKMAEYLDSHYPPGTKVGVFDIGAIAYFSHMDVLDLGGLVDRNYLPYLISGRVPQYLRQQGAQYVVLPINSAEAMQDGGQANFGQILHLLNNPALRLEPIHSEGVDFNTWDNGNLYSQNAYEYQILYRVVPLDPDGTPALPEGR